MTAFTYLKNKQEKIQSKYHRISKQFESQYNLIRRKLTSRFNREPTKTDLVRFRINNLITQSKESIERKFNSANFIPVGLRTSIENNDMNYPDIIDWFQGRFSGQTIRIFVREGKIIEKIFVSPKGNKISVKRGKLELVIRSMPTMQFKLRLRISPMAFIKFKPKIIDIRAF